MARRGDWTAKRWSFPPAPLPSTAGLPGPPILETISNIVA